MLDHSQPRQPRQPCVPTWQRLQSTRRKTWRAAGGQPDPALVPLLRVRPEPLRTASLNTLREPGASSCDLECVKRARMSLSSMLHDESVVDGNRISIKMAHQPIRSTQSPVEASSRPSSFETRNRAHPRLPGTVPFSHKRKKNIDQRQYRSAPYPHYKHRTWKVSCSHRDHHRARSLTLGSALQAKRP